MSQRLPMSEKRKCSWSGLSHSFNLNSRSSEKNVSEREMNMVFDLQATICLSENNLNGSVWTKNFLLFNRSLNYSTNKQNVSISKTTTYCDNECYKTKIIFWKRSHTIQFMHHIHFVRSQQLSNHCWWYHKHLFVFIDEAKEHSKNSKMRLYMVTI